MKKKCGIIVCPAICGALDWALQHAATVPCQQANSVEQPLSLQKGVSWQHFLSHPAHVVTGLRHRQLRGFVRQKFLPLPVLGLQTCSVGHRCRWSRNSHRGAGVHKLLAFTSLIIYISQPEKHRCCLPLPGVAGPSRILQCRILRDIRSVSFLVCLMLCSLLTFSHSYLIYVAVPLPVHCFWRCLDHCLCCQWEIPEVITAPDLQNYILP